MTIESNGQQPDGDPIENLKKLLSKILESATEVGDGIDKLKTEVKGISTDLAGTWRRASERLREALGK